MNRIGDILKAERINQGKGLKDIERETKIRTKYLLAIEKGDFDVLPGGAYHKAFIKSYCNALGVDSALLLDAYQQVVDNKPVQHEPIPAKSFFKPRYKTQGLFSPPTAILILKAALVVLLLSVFYIKILGPLFSGDTAGGSRSSSAKTASLDKGDELRIKVVEPGAWIKVIVDGKTSYQQITGPDSGLKFNGKGFKIISGNASAVKVSYEGSTFEPLGSKNDVTTKFFGEEN